MTTTRKKRPSDPVQFAKLIGDIATGKTPDAEDDGKDAAAPKPQSNPGKDGCSGPRTRS